LATLQGGGSCKMGNLQHFQFEDVGHRIGDLETPVPLIDIEIVWRNLGRWQDRCNALGLANRPHIKTHKLVALAKTQIELGASGITVQKLGEAEVMADAGITEMLLTFNVVGAKKLERLAALVRRTNISVVADSAEVVAGLAHAGQLAGRDISVLVEIDTGARRNGVQTPQAALALAQLIDRTRGVSYGGLMTYPRAGMRIEAEGFFLAARDLMAQSGLDTSTISSGGSPDMWKDDGLSQVTEYRVGTYIYFDRSLTERGTCKSGDCALSVLTTVVSRPTEDRALIDAGSKALTSDLLGLVGYGIVQDLNRAKVYDVNEEHGYLDVSTSSRKPKVGDLLRVTPNHVCPVVNLFDKVVFTRGSEVLGAVRVDARGRVQ
jgi:D-serine deaminase-like pyridoxal phosphate-dependent protein